MSCDDVTRELAVPTAGHDPAALAAHLEVCPTCAAQAEREARFDRLWAATRPAEPSEPAWADVWAAVSARLDGPVVVTVTHAATGTNGVIHHAPPRRPTSPARRWGVVLFSLAQAAAVLVAFTLMAPRHSSTSPDLPDFAAAVPGPVDIASGQLVLIGEAGQVARTLDASDDAGVDPGFALFNAVEAMAVAPVKVDIDAGQVVLITEDGQDVRTVELAADTGNSAGVDAGFAMFNAIEAMAD